MSIFLQKHRTKTFACVLALVLLLCGLGLHPLTARAEALSLGQNEQL